MESKLILDCAFSRDQTDKLYVQHKMLEKSQEIWEWLNAGSYIFVCGDASKMAKDVDKILHEIVEKEGRLNSVDAKNYLKHLRQNKRYQRDVY